MRTIRNTTLTNARIAVCLSYHYIADRSLVIEGMLRLDTSQPETATLTNVSIPTFLRPRLDGSMIHVPVGKKGILVLIGGQTTADPTTPWGVPVVHASWGNIMVRTAICFM